MLSLAVDEGAVLGGTQTPRKLGKLLLQSRFPSLIRARVHNRSELPESPLGCSLINTHSRSRYKLASSGLPPCLTDIGVKIVASRKFHVIMYVNILPSKPNKLKYVRSN